MDIYRSMAGSVRVELTSADVPGALERICEGGISFSDANWKSDLTVELTIRRLDYHRLKLICQRKGDTLKLCRRLGIYWTAKGLLHRPVLLFGMALLLFLIFFLPSRVFFVEVEGNNAVPARLIQEAAAECGISFGASRREVRSERVKNALLEAVPQLQWAGVNTRGCVAVISVRERSILEEKEAELGFGHIVALRDGVITSCTATQGNLICGVGQAVGKGDVLISGYTDCGICIRATQAEGEVFAQTRRQLHVVLPAVYEYRAVKGEEKQKISLLLGKKRINLWKDSGISPGSCGRMYQEYDLTLPGGFQLPVAIAVETYAQWELEADSMPEEQMQQILTEFAGDYLHSQMVAGVVHSQELSFSKEEEYCLLEGEFVCVEMIGSRQRLTIGEDHVKTD